MARFVLTLMEVGRETTFHSFPSTHAAYVEPVSICPHAELASDNRSTLRSRGNLLDPSFFFKGGGGGTCAVAFVASQLKTSRQQCPLRTYCRLRAIGSNMTFAGDDLQALVNMLGNQRDAGSTTGITRSTAQTHGYSLQESEDGGLQAPRAAAGPGGIHVSTYTHDKDILPVATMTRAGREAQKPKKPTGNSIWGDDEVSDTVVTPTIVGATASTRAVDRRKAPEYDILYKDVVGAQDVFLGAQFDKDGSSFSSDGLVVKVKMPLLESVADVELSVLPMVLTVRSRDYALKVDLPRKCVENSGRAQWDAAKKVLSISLTIHHDRNEVLLL